eukprot:352989-Chlamydomonas_euryale.AAC.3
MHDRLPFRGEPGVGEPAPATATAAAHAGRPAPHTCDTSRLHWLHVPTPAAPAGPVDSPSPHLRHQQARLAARRVQCRMEHQARRDAASAAVVLTSVKRGVTGRVVE